MTLVIAPDDHAGVDGNRRIPCADAYDRIGTPIKLLRKASTTGHLRLISFEAHADKRETFTLTRTHGAWTGQWRQGNKPALAVTLRPTPR